MKNEVITIDLGSNSFRVLKYDCLNFKIIDEYHQVVGLPVKYFSTSPSFAFMLN